MSRVAGPDVGIEFDSGSFRDRGSRVFHTQGRVYRALSAEALRAWTHISGQPFFEQTQRDGRTIPTRLVEDVIAPADDGVEWSGVLSHDAIPLISYPYEWCFGMLREAALLHLALLEEALRDGVILKDATPFNVQFVGTRPTFIDIPSFVPHDPGEAWIGYRQFCQTLLYPLMLQAYRGVDFQPLLRGRLSGVSPRDARRLLSLRDWLRRGVLAHVVLHAAFESRLPSDDHSVAREMQSRGFNQAMIVANIRKLRATVERLTWREKGSLWSAYDSRSDAVRQDSACKEQFVEAALDGVAGRLVWDLGCNAGRYSRLAANRGAYVVAIDSDHWTIEQLFQDLRRTQERRILPLVMNLADPSPNLGWGGRERRSVEHRGQPQLVLALALIHHLVIRENLRMSDLLDWLARCGARLVIEFIEREDVQVRSLLHNRPDSCADYDRGHFERQLRARFEVVRQQPLPSGTRILFDVVPLR